MKLFSATIIIYVLYILLKTKKSLHMLQQNRYNRGNKYLKWLQKNKRKQFLTIELGTFLIPILLLLGKQIAISYFLLYYFILIIYFFYKEKTSQKKLPLKWTGRIIRLFITTLLLYGIVITICSKGFNQNEQWTYCILIIIAYLNSLVVVLSNLINHPIEESINNYFHKKATKKLKALRNLTVVGVTGSYGKTSSKNIIADILNVKYNVLPSPKNYNTPLGLMITINEYLDKFTDYFIAEMGACKIKEIKELCDLVHPKYGVLTKIGVAHLETFGSQENITKTKFELIESLPQDGLGILNADDQLQVSYQLKAKCPLLWVGIDNQEKADIYATNIILSQEGTTFDCHFKRKRKTVHLKTKLLGKANIYNILAAIALGDYLGLSMEQLSFGVSKVKPVEHRLELKPFYDMHLIDDAYNANPEGTKMALDVLNLMPGKKIVISSGMIELGEKNEELNKELGMYMYDKIDIAILIGKEQTKPIYNGLLAKNFNKKNIYVFNDIMEAFAFLPKIKDKNTYILLQSDLPDIFNES